MNYYLYPSLEPELGCPSRYTRSRVRREEVQGCFASGFFGKVVHERIARCLRTGKALDTSEIQPPRRVILKEGDDLEALGKRAQSCLACFEEAYLSWFAEKDIIAIEERVAWNLPGKPACFSGILDLVISIPRGELIVDWKTGSLVASEDQLRSYLALRHQQTGCQDLQAQAVSLSSQETVELRWDEELEGWLMSKAERMITSLKHIEANPHSLSPGPCCHYCPYAHDCPASITEPRRLLDTRTGELMEL